MVCWWSRLIVRCVSVVAVSCVLSVVRCVLFVVRSVAVSQCACRCVFVVVCCCCAGC